MSRRQLQMVSITLSLGYPALALAVGARGPHWISLVVILCTLACLWTRHIIGSRQAYKAVMEGSQARIDEDILLRSKRTSDYIASRGGRDLG